jgi:hypothetical protein
VIHVEVAGADGTVATWRVNSYPPNTTKRLGFSEASFAVGTELSVEGYQALDGSNRVNSTSILFKDGKSIRMADCFAGGPYCYSSTR